MSGHEKVMCGRGVRDDSSQRQALESEDEFPLEPLGSVGAETDREGVTELWMCSGLEVKDSWEASRFLQVWLYQIVEKSLPIAANVWWCSSSITPLVMSRMMWSMLGKEAALKLVKLHRLSQLLPSRSRRCGVRTRPQCWSLQRLWKPYFPVMDR